MCSENAFDETPVSCACILYSWWLLSTSWIPTCNFLYLSWDWAPKTDSELHVTGNLLCLKNCHKILCVYDVKMAVLWVFSAWSLVVVYLLLAAWIRASPWCWRQQVPLKCRYASARLHGATTHKTSHSRLFCRCHARIFMLRIKLKNADVVCMERK
jgi:hypothetical protein